MSQWVYREFYRRHLPHYQPPGATLFITFRLAGSLPKAVLEELEAEAQRQERRLEAIADEKERAAQADRLARHLFGRWDEALHRRSNGPYNLQEPQVAALVAESLRYRDGRVYTLHAFCIMPNHVHLVCTPLPVVPVGQDDILSYGQANVVGQDGILPYGQVDNLSYEYVPLAQILHSLKRYTAREANRLLGRTGAFWQHESYDHVVRDAAELERVIRYVANNPVAAGLVQEWTEWPWTYVGQFA